jgi:hypothetical protein
MTTYLIEVADITSDRNIAHAYGDLDAMAYHARRLKADHLVDGHVYALKVTEAAGVLGDERRTVAEVTGEAEIVTYVLNKRLRGERGRAATTSPSLPEPEPAE